VEIEKADFFPALVERSEDMLKRHRRTNAGDNKRDVMDKRLRKTNGDERREGQQAGCEGLERSTGSRQR
jgi:hypothetical protein